MGRRGEGEGSIYQDAAGRWRGFVDLGYAGGKRRRKYVSGDTRREVAAGIRAATQARDAGLIVSTERTPTLGEWLTFWLDTIAAARVRPSTLAAYRGYVRNHIAPALGHHRLDKLQPEHLETFYRERTRQGLSPTTVLHMHRILSRALKIAMRRGRVPRNVATLVDAPSVRRTEIQPLTAAEVRRVLVAAAGRRNAARWSVALSLGLRQGEALGLAWCDIDLDRSTLTVRQALQRQPGGGLVLVPPKSTAGRRTVVLPAPLAASLRTHRAAQNIERLTAGSLWIDSGLVFTTPLGTPLDPRNDYRAWRGPADRRRRPASPAARRPAYRGNAVAGPGRAGPGGDADSRSHPDFFDPRHLQPRRSGAGPGRRGPDGGRAVGRPVGGACGQLRLPNRLPACRRRSC